MNYEQEGNAFSREDDQLIVDLEAQESFKEYFSLEERQENFAEEHGLLSWNSCLPELQFIFWLKEREVSHIPVFLAQAPTKDVALLCLVRAKVESLLYNELHRLPDLQQRPYLEFLQAVDRIIQLKNFAEHEELPEDWEIKMPHYLVLYFIQSGKLEEAHEVFERYTFKKYQLQMIYHWLQQRHHAILEQANWQNSTPKEEVAQQYADWAEELGETLKLHK